MDYNEQRGIKSLDFINKKQVGEKLKENIRAGWIFETWYEKLILMILMLMGGWKLVGFVT